MRAEITERVKNFLAVHEERKLREKKEEQARAALELPQDRREAIVAPPPAAPAKRKARKPRRLDPSDRRLLH